MGRLWYFWTQSGSCRRGRCDLLLLALQCGQIRYDVTDLRFGEDAEHGGHDGHGWRDGDDLIAGNGLGFAIWEAQSDLFCVFFPQNGGEGFAVLGGDGDEAVAGGDLG